jgi:hypothetical protein
VEEEFMSRKHEMYSAVERIKINADDDDDDTTEAEMVASTLMTFKEMVHCLVIASNSANN